MRSASISFRLDTRPTEPLSHPLLIFGPSSPSRHMPAAQLKQIPSDPPSGSCTIVRVNTCSGIHSWLRLPNDTFTTSLQQQSFS